MAGMQATLFLVFSVRFSLLLVFEVVGSSSSTLEDFASFK